MPPNDEQYTELARDLRNATSQLTETTTVLRQHIVEQRGTNQRMERLVGDQERRLRHVEARQAVVEERLPAKLVDGDEIHDDLERLNVKVDGLAVKVWGWSGGIAAMVTLGGFLLKYWLG